MDYLQTLEFRMAALQRKIRLLQDLRFFFETATPEELAAFGDELRSVMTGSGRSVGDLLAALLGSNRMVAGASPSSAAGAAPSAGLPVAPERPVPASPPPVAGRPSSAAALDESRNAVSVESASDDLRSEALASVEPSMRPIAAGSFVMGSETGGDDEKPPHKVSLAAYRVCDHLATNSEYALFVRAQPQWSKDRADPALRDDNYLSDWTGDAYPEGKGDHPVAFVSYHAAQAYAAWLGKRLLREAEWECAARGGLVGKKYPNGDQMNDSLANLAKQYRGTTPVKKFAANGFGLFDMSGNLFEWTSDWYGPYSAAEVADPQGPDEGEYKVVRGGSWMSGAGALRVSARVDMESVTCGQVGIRLADGA